MGWLAENSWLYIGSVSGSIIAMMMARNLSLSGRVQTLVVGTLSGCLAGPAVCEIWLSQYDPKTSSVPTLVCGFIGLVALGIIPIVMRKSKEWLEKYQIRIVPTETPNE